MFIGGFQKCFFLQGERAIFNNWGRARTGGNNCFSFFFARGSSFA